MALQTVALMLGGQSPEHEISLRSARNIAAAIDRTRFKLVLIGVTIKGTWTLLPDDFFETAPPMLTAAPLPLVIVPGAGASAIREAESGQVVGPIDLVFPIIHGPNGEDGTLQGLLRQLGLPFVGPDVLGSAAAMDKDVCKRLLLEADLQTADYICFQYFEREAIDPLVVVNKLGLPLFVKPANMGSSVGVHRVDKTGDLLPAIADAFRFDHKVLVETFIAGRELECAVLGNGLIETTGVGEVEMAAGFYDFDSKYESEDAAKVKIPAEGLNREQMAKLVMVARSAYQAVGCEGLARVDMFLTEEDAVYVNEINTLPGFTNISMYPKLWEAQDLAYTDLLSRLLELALERGKRTEALEKMRV